MGSSKKTRTSSGGSLSLKTANKIRRQQLYIAHKKATGKARHQERHRRRKEEAQNPELKRKRLEANQPASIDKKRIWDDVDDDSLGAVVDVAQLKRRRLEEAEAAAAAEADALMKEDQEREEKDGDIDSMLGSDEEDEGGENDQERMEEIQRQRAQRQPSIAPSTTSTNLDLTPDSLAAQFKHLFSDEPPPMPKILVTTGINGTIHQEAQEIAAIFPNGELRLPPNRPATASASNAYESAATYIRRTAHRYAYKYSVREIAKFAKSKETPRLHRLSVTTTNRLLSLQDRGYTALLVVHEDQKRPSQLSVCHLNGEDVPPGPTLTYTIRNYQPGKVIVGHGRATNHYVRNRGSPHLRSRPLTGDLAGASPQQLQDPAGFAGRQVHVHTVPCQA